MTAPPENAPVRELRVHIHELELQNTDLKHQVTELRAAVALPDHPGEWTATATLFRLYPLRAQIAGARRSRHCWTTRNTSHATRLRARHWFLNPASLRHNEACSCMPLRLREASPNSLAVRLTSQTRASQTRAYR